MACFYFGSTIWTIFILFVFFTSPISVCRACSLESLFYDSKLSSINVEILMFLLSKLESYEVPTKNVLKSSISYVATKFICCKAPKESIRKTTISAIVLLLLADNCSFFKSETVSFLLYKLYSFNYSAISSAKSASRTIFNKLKSFCSFFCY